MANASYDLGWMRSCGIISGSDVPSYRIVDVQILAALLEEDHPAGYSLNALGARYLKEKKDERLLRRAARALEIDPKSQMALLPARYVGQYAEQDASLTLRLGLYLDSLITKDGLCAIRDLETSLTPLFSIMEAQGIRFDTEAAIQLNARLRRQEAIMQKNLGIDVWRPSEVAKALIAEGYTLPYTDKGNVSCNKKVLSSLDGPIPKQIRELRQISRLRQTYVENAMTFLQNGRIYPQFIQMGRDDEGTVTGRVSAKDPNIQQVPKRSEIGKEIRKLYLADEGKLWGKADYSSQEPRLQVHFALACQIDSAAATRDAFHRGVKLYTFIEEELKGRISYDDAKAIVLGRSYRMGIKTLSEMLHKPQDECQSLLDIFDSSFPYLSQLADRAEQVARTRGYLTTLGGRRRHFDYWEPDERTNKPPIYGYANAVAAYGKVRRAHIRKAFNSLIQGSAADQTKAAMLKLWQQYGVIPYLQAHDELGLPLPEEDTEQEAKKLTDVMANAIPDLNIDFVVDCDIARHWQ